MKNKKITNKHTRNAHVLVAICLIVLMLPACKKYLAASPDKQLTTPNTIQDLRSLLDYNDLMDGNYSCYGAIASDDYYVPYTSYNSLRDVVAKNNYVWGLISETTGEYSDWLLNYKRIFQVNVVLDNFKRVKNNGASTDEMNNIRGEALFYRGLTIFTLSQVYALPYNPATATTTPGIPYRLTADINEKIRRSTLEDNYNHITTDLMNAAHLLPTNNTSLLRPDRQAAWAALANVYLVMEQYDKAESYADSCLYLKDNLIDYNTISLASSTPFELFNKEVIWQADLAYNTVLATTRSKIDTTFYQSFDDSDLRKNIYFQKTGNNPAVFKGHYNGKWQGTSVYFAGFATDEVYLIKSECQARLGSVSEALATLNKLLVNRYDKARFTPVNATSQQQALDIILEQRRKELCFRGSLRWMDIRRLNQYENSKMTILREIGGNTYSLPPGDLHFAFLIPQNSVDNSHLDQNKR